MMSDDLAVADSPGVPPQMTDPRGVYHMTHLQDLLEGHKAPLRLRVRDESGQFEDDPELYEGYPHELILAVCVPSSFVLAVQRAWHNAVLYPAIGLDGERSRLRTALGYSRPAILQGMPRRIAGETDLRETVSRLAGSARQQLWSQVGTPNPEQVGGYSRTYARIEEGKLCFTVPDDILLRMVRSVQRSIEPGELLRLPRSQY